VGVGVAVTLIGQSESRTNEWPHHHRSRLDGLAAAALSLMFLLLLLLAATAAVSVFPSYQNVVHAALS
jgi:hypothetical protein